jgi:hypothetical protein
MCIRKLTGTKSTCGGLSLAALLSPQARSLRNSTTLIVGQSGCAAWVFPRSTLMPFLEANPGILLSLLGTQVVI